MGNNLLKVCKKILPLMKEAINPGSLISWDNVEELERAIAKEEGPEESKKLTAEELNEPPESFEPEEEE